jgi:5-dehydro-4-deoxyglucarate dehydratase
LPRGYCDYYGYCGDPPMKPDQLRSRLNGVIGFPITPFKRDDLSLDVDGLRMNLRAMLKHPFAAIVAPSGTGELYSLSTDEHRAIVQTAVEEAGRVPVIAGVGINTAIAREWVKTAAAAGAAGILVFPPYYPGADDEGLVAYYRSIADASALGVMIYSRDWFNPSPAMVEKLAASIPNLIAWKDGQADLRRYQMIRQRLGDRLHWIGGAGDDMVPGYYAIGIRTYTSSISNVAPRLSLKLHELASAGASPELTRLMNALVIPLYALRARRKGYEVSAMKAMMDELSLVGGPSRPPLVDVTSADLESLRALLPAWREWV